MNEELKNIDDFLINEDLNIEKIQEEIINSDDYEYNKYFLTGITYSLIDRTEESSKKIGKKIITKYFYYDTYGGLASNGVQQIVENI